MNPHPQAVDTVIEARWVLPIEPSRSVLPDHAVVINGGRIVALLPASEARINYTPKQHVVLGEHALIPGLINLHTHAAMTLLRGLADDLALMDWLNRHIWPAEMRHVSEEFVYDGARLACAEMLRGGVTCFNDMYFFPQATARAALATRMRAALGMIVVEFPSPYAADAQDYLNKGLALRDELKSEPLLSYCFAPHAPYTVSDKTLRQVATYAGELDLPVHMHLHETRHEIERSLEQHHLRPLARLAEFGLLGPGLIAVHAVHLERGEIELLAQHGCHVAHCPSSNLKLASGFAPVGALLAAGVNVGLGTDGAASNNRLDIFFEMRLAALLAKGVSDNATALPAWQALEMATIRSARALGLDKMIGTLQPGKCADITAVRIAGPELAPCYDPQSHLVYAAGREHVSHVWVNGELVVDNGNLTTIDTDEVLARAAFWHDRIRS
ncbi:MAG: TRZ/ATZ family hydrolase [Betaproteobacteria bacterium]|nr:MAG: TRZ/ATZ family hydrolase [Betaproteobacteria bacterium]